MVEQMPKNDSNDLEDKVRTLQEQNAKLIQILRSQGCSVDSLIQTENQSNLIQPINVVPLESISTFLSPSNNNVDQHQISIRPKPISNEILTTKLKSESTSNVETTNLLDNESNHKHPRPIRPKPSLQLFNSLTLTENKPMFNNVLTPSALINNTNSSTVSILSPSTSFDESSTNQTKKFSKTSRPRIRKPTTTPIPIAPNLGRPLAPAPLNVQRIVTTIKRSSSHNGSTKKRPSKSLVSRSPPTDRFAESISGLMKDFDQELIASNFLSTPTTTNILSDEDFPVDNEPMTTFITDDEMRLVEMNFDETTFLKQFDFDETTLKIPNSSDDHLYPSLLNPTRHSSTTIDSIYPGSSLINNNVFTTIVPLSMQNSLETNRIHSTRLLPEEGVRLTARHIEPSQVATYESTKYPDILDDLVTVTDQDVLTHAQTTTTNNEFPLNLFERTKEEETSNEFVDLQYFYPTKTDEEENSSPKSDVEQTITDLTSIIQIGQNHSSPKQIETSSIVHRIVFEPILSPPMTTSSIDEKIPTETSTNNEQYSNRSTTLKMKIPKEKRRKSSSNAEQIENPTSLNHQIPPTPGDYDETYSQQIHSNDEQMNKTMFITPPPDNDNHEQKSSSDDFQHLKKSKKDHFDCSTTNSQYISPMTTSVAPLVPNPVDPYAQTYDHHHQYHSTNNGSTPFFHYSYNSHPYMNSQTLVPPPSATHYYHPPSYTYHPHPTYHPHSNYMSSHDHHSYNR